MNRTQNLVRTTAIAPIAAITVFVLLTTLVTAPMAHAAPPAFGGVDTVGDAMVITVETASLRAPVPLADRLADAIQVHPTLVEALSRLEPVPLTLTIVLPSVEDPLYATHPARDGDLSPLVVDLTMAALPGTARFAATGGAVETFHGSFTGDALASFLDSPYLLGVDPGTETGTNPPVDAPLPTLVQKATCSYSSTTACLHYPRFAVTASWNGGTATRACNSSQFATFHGGGSTNWEILVNVINGCGVNSHYWVQAGGATGQSWSFSVQDFTSGLKRAYTGSCPVISTLAFPC